MEEEKDPLEKYIENAISELEATLRRFDEQDWHFVRDAFNFNWSRKSIPLTEDELDQVWMTASTKVRPKKQTGVSFSTDGKVEFNSWDEVNNFSFPANRWRIKHLLPMEGIVIIAAISGERKSWFAFEMMNALTTPRNFLHTDRFPVIGCNVLYIDVEMGRYIVRKRGRQLGFNDKHAHKMIFVTEGMLNLKKNEDDTENDDFNRILDLIKEEDIHVVFIDTFRGVAGGLKEEKAEEIRTFFSRFLELNDMGVCFVFLDHFRKPSHFEGKVPKKEHLFASQDKVSVSTILLMLRTETGSEITSVYQRKNRLAPEIQPFAFRMEDSAIDDEDNNETKMTYDGELDSAESKMEQAQETIVEALEDGPKTRKQLIGIVYKANKIAERTTSEACRQLEANKLIECTKRGKENLYSLKPPQNGDTADKDVGKNDDDNNSATTLPMNDLTN